MTAAEPGRRFAFDVDFAGVPIARWAYDLEPTPTGCTVTESWDDRRGRPLPIASVPLMGIADRAEHNRRSMQTTLTALRLAAEG